MKVPYQVQTQKPKPEEEADLYVVGNSFMVDTPSGVQIRVGPMTPEQWALIGQAAGERNVKTARRRKR